MLSVVLNQDDSFETEGDFGEDTEWTKWDYRPRDAAVCYVMERDEKLVWQIINKGRSIYVSGKAGSGKSHLLVRFLEHAKSSDMKVCSTASTAIAALHIGVCTLHSALGLQLAEKKAIELWNDIRKHPKTFKNTKRFLTETDVLVIDEISMVQPVFFAKLDYLARKVRNVNKPFGGMRLVMVGDFTQLGPVDKKAQREKYVFQTEAWRVLNPVRLFLNRNMRQNDDRAFAELLDRVRVGCMTPEDHRLLQSRVGLTMKVQGPVIQRGSVQERPVLRPMRVFTHLKQVKTHNSRELALLIERGARVHRFPPYLGISVVENKPTKNKTDMDKAKKLKSLPLEILERKSVFPVMGVDLTVGSQVMMRCNDYMMDGVVNGTLGWVSNVDDHGIDVFFMHDGKFMDVPIRVERKQFRHRVGYTVDLTLNQFPLSLAWATTVHKVQGLTLDAIHLDVSQSFEAGQVYTALSRVRHLENLVMDRYDPQSITADQAAVAFETPPDVAERDPKRQKTNAA